MISFVLFLIAISFLCIEGRLLMQLIVGKYCTKLEQWILSFPLAVAVNPLIFFTYTVLGIPLTLLSIVSAHLLFIVLIGYYVRKYHSSQTLFSINLREECQNFSFAIKLLIIILIISILIKIFYGIAHAVLFPTFYFDAISQWTMRAKISYFDNAIAFDVDELRGMSKPQYPILLHTLQIFVMSFQYGWKDVIANASTLILSLSSFVGIALILSRLRGLLFSVLTIALLFMIPLFSEHLTQGYGDIHVIEYILLSAVFGYLALIHSSRRLLILSALFCAGAAWVKQDGLVFGVVPWIVMMASVAGIEPLRRADIIRGIVSVIFFGSLWSLLLLFRGMSISPHSGDAVLSWHPEAIPMALFTLFSAGSFGIYWYVIFVLLIIVCVQIRTQWRNFVPELFVLLWGIITFCEALVVFLGTHNVSFLLNSQTFSRTMMIPLCLCIFGILLIGQRLKGSDSTLTKPFNSIQ